MTPAELDARCRALADLLPNVTPGPWTAVGHELYFGLINLSRHQQISREPDCQYIAACDPTFLSALLAERETMRERIAAFEDAYECHRSRMELAESERETMRLELERATALMFAAQNNSIDRSEGLLAELETMRAERDELIAEGKEAVTKRLMDECRLHSLHCEGGEFQMTMTVAEEIMKRFVMAAKVFLDGAENYSETTIRETAEAGSDALRVEQLLQPSGGEPGYVLTIQRRGKKTPHQLRREAEADRDDLRRRLTDAEGKVAELECTLDDEETAHRETLNMLARASGPAAGQQGE